MDPPKYNIPPDNYIPPEFDIPPEDNIPPTLGVATGEPYVAGTTAEAMYHHQQLQPEFGIPPECDIPPEDNIPSVLGVAGTTADAMYHEKLYHRQIEQFQQHYQQQQLRTFWADQYREIEQTTDFKKKKHNLPLKCIRDIMHADEDVHMIAAETPVLFSRACEMFILELTMRSWAIAQKDNLRRTLRRNDIATAIASANAFEFLQDRVLRVDRKKEVPPSTDTMA
ncbi:Nuclear transcription factor Y subunit C-2 [Canna indica]|uniref:Nuclear transcription factor Y subunit C-2 n=1 Tax=Canna indica TaxID=4628 RepID=A0AAQ3JSK1_9LILI|nr:Nuclear transcription factor Y subunit C-2 [Canna indica]